MGRKTDLKPEEKQRIVELLSHGKTSLDISKLIHRDHRTVKRFMENSNKVRRRADKGKFQKISHREINSVKKTLSNPHSANAKIFHEARVPLRSRAGRCKILRADVCENRDSCDSLKKPKFCLFHQNILFRELF